jgi:exosome complex component RRP43
LAEPDNTEPDHGFIIPNIDMTKLCSPKYRAIGVSVGSQVLNQTLFNILINSGCVDLKELCIAKGKLAWVLYCDLVCLDDDGAVLDVAALSLMTALKSLKLPKVTYDSDTKAIKADDKIKKPLNLKCLPVTSTFVLFEEKFLLADPTADEESIIETTVTISVSDGEISYVYQPGGSSLLPQQFESLVKQATNREKYLKSLLESIFK